MPAQRFHLSCGNGFQDFKSLVKPGFSICHFIKPYRMVWPFLFPDVRQ
jgi:hypothetical protein